MKVFPGRYSLYHILKFMQFNKVNHIVVGSFSNFLFYANNFRDFRKHQMIFLRRKKSKLAELKKLNDMYNIFCRIC